MTLEWAQFFKQNTKSTNKMIIEIMDFIKIKTFFSSNGYMRRRKRQHREQKLREMQFLNKSFIQIIRTSNLNQKITANLVTMRLKTQAKVWLYKQNAYDNVTYINHQRKAK